MRRTLLVLAGFLFIPFFGHAQAPPQAQPRPPAQQRSLLSHMQQAYKELKVNLTWVAARLPEADYGITVSMWNENEKVMEDRTYGRIIADLVWGQYVDCAAIKGVANPHEGTDLELTLKTKPAIVKALADSFVLCDQAVSSLTDLSLTQPVKLGKGNVVAALMHVIGHGNRHAWQIVQRRIGNKQL